MTANKLNASNCIVVRPNCSLSWRGACGVFAGIALVSIGIASGFAALGLWMVLPFAGLEMLLLGGVLWRIQCQQRRFEVIDFSGDKVVIAQADRQLRSSVELPKAWLSVRLEQVAQQHSHLLLCSGRNRVEVGACLTDEERLSLAEELKRRLRWSGCLVQQLQAAT